MIDYDSEFDVDVETQAEIFAIKTDDEIIKSYIEEQEAKAKEAIDDIDDIDSIIDEELKLVPK